jgi:Co/Zn/Cd efflux system component
MSNSCCQNKNKDLEVLRKEHSNILWIVLLINISMFAIEIVTGFRSKSLALTGDSLDMLGDALVYSSSIFVIYKSQQAQARVSLLKGFIMLGFAFLVLIRGLYQIHNWSIPIHQTMSSIGLLALAANLSCLLLLTKHKNDNLNMSSVWICSRNDIIANSSVLVAAFVTSITYSPIPDIFVGFLLTFIFTKSSIKVIKASRRELVL